MLIRDFHVHFFLPKAIVPHLIPSKMKRIKSLVIVFFSVLSLSLASCSDEYIAPQLETEGENHPVTIEDDSHTGGNNGGG